MWVIGRRACDVIGAAVRGDNQAIIDLTLECPFENDLMTGRIVQLAALTIAHMDTEPDEMIAHLRGHTDKLGQHQVAESNDDD